MNRKSLLTRGTLGLALAASVFLGCQDFLGEEKATQAPPASDAGVQSVAQGVASTEVAKDMPAQAEVATGPAHGTALVRAGKPVIATESIAATEPEKSSPPAASAPLTPEQEACLELYNQVLTGGSTYPHAKNHYFEGNCDAVLGDQKPAPPPWTPPTTEELCRMFRQNLTTHTPPPEDTKYQAYVAEMQVTCAAYP